MYKKASQSNANHPHANRCMGYIVNKVHVRSHGIPLLHEQTDRHTDTTENITFPQSVTVVKMLT